MSFFVFGFIKRAQEYGLSEGQAVDLLKRAIDDQAPSKAAPSLGESSGAATAATAGNVGLASVGQRVVDQAKPVAGVVSKVVPTAEEGSRLISKAIKPTLRGVLGAARTSGAGLATAPLTFAVNSLMPQSNENDPSVASQVFSKIRDPLVGSVALPFIPGARAKAMYGAGLVAEPVVKDLAGRLGSWSWERNQPK